MCRLLFVIAAIAVSLGFVLSLPGLDDYEKYRENEGLARAGATHAASAIEREESLARAEEMARLKRAGLSRGMTAVALIVVGIGAGMLHLTLWIWRRSLRTRRSGGAGVLASVCSTVLTIQVVGLALTPVLYVLAALFFL
jgi:hypothetical protein